MAKSPLKQLFLSFALLSFFSGTLFGQSDPDTEPDVDTFISVNSPYSESFTRGRSGNFILSNFGFGLGGQLERALSPYTTFYYGIQAIGLRDPSEQTFQDIFGQQFIPNKYNRILAFPIVVGIKKRFFAEPLSDNFRFHAHAMAGPAFAFVYPYFNDLNGDGVLDAQREVVYDVLQGWDQGYIENGVVSELGISIDFGDDMKAISSAYLGVYMYYYFDGIQVMEPNSYERGVLVPDTDRQYLFVSPIIRFAFGQYRNKNKSGK